MYTNLNIDPCIERTEVGFDNGKYSTGILRTKGVNGCNVIIARTLTGGIDPIPGIMTHYSPNYMDGNIEKLKELTHEHKELLSGEKRVALFSAELDEIRTKELETSVRGLLGEISIFKRIGYTEVYYTLCTLDDGIIEFHVPTGKYGFIPVVNKENPEFNGIL